MKNKTKQKTNIKTMEILQCAILLFYTFASLAQALPVREGCDVKIAAQKAVACANPIKVLYWSFNAEHSECLALSRLACDGDKPETEIFQNLYSTYTRCTDSCKYMDGPSCAAGSSPAKDSRTNEYITCGMAEFDLYGEDYAQQPISKCPDGYICRMGAFSGTCCNQTLEDTYARNYRPKCKCPNQNVEMPPLMHEAGGIPLVLLGENCSDNFCSAGSTCHKLEFFAHCCPDECGPNTIQQSIFPEPTCRDGTQALQLSGEPNCRLGATDCPLGYQCAQLSDGSTQCCHAALDDPVVLRDDGNVIAPQKFEHPNQGGVCLEARPRQPILNCKDRTKYIFYHYVAQSGECLAFGMERCLNDPFIENANFFASWSECNSKCKLMDGPACSSGLEAPPHPSNGPYSCGQDLENPEVERKCPEGYTCRRGPWHGACCLESAEALYDRNYRPTCDCEGVQREPRRFQSGGVPMVFLGKNCSDNFCSGGETCVQQELFAHCCQCNTVVPAPVKTCPDGSAPIDDSASNNLNRCDLGGDFCPGRSRCTLLNDRTLACCQTGKRGVQLQDEAQKQDSSGNTVAFTQSAMQQARLSLIAVLSSLIISRLFL